MLVEERPGRTGRVGPSEGGRGSPGSAGPPSPPPAGPGSAPAPIGHTGTALAGSNQSPHLDLERISLERESGYIFLEKSGHLLK